MSFSGRLSGGGSSNDHQEDNSVVPISMSSSNFEDDRLSLPIHNQVLISRTIQDGQKEILVDDLIGKKHAFKKYDQFALNTSCFCGSTGSNITSVVQFHEIFVTKIMNKLIYIVEAKISRNCTTLH